MKSLDSLKIILEPKISVQKSVRLNIMGNPTYGMAAMTPSLTPGDIMVTGAESQINSIQDVRVDVDIASANAEISKVLPVRVLDKTGKDIQNIVVEPGNVKVNIPIEDTKRVSLSLDIIGQPAQGYIVSSTSVQPEEIFVTGKKEILTGIDSLKTEKIDITGENAVISKKVRLITPEGTEIVDDENVSISINIEKITTTEIMIKDLEYVNLPGDMELVSIQGDIKVTLRGAESRIVDAPRTVKYYVNLKDAVEGSNVRNVLWEAPQGIEVIEVSPAQAEVMLIKKPQQ